MAQYIDKSAVVAEIERLKVHSEEAIQEFGREGYMDNVLFEQAKICTCETLLSFLDTIDVKEVDEQKERIDECPYRQVGCTMYKDKILECNGVCSWVVDHLKLKELKAQKGEEYESK